MSEQTTATVTTTERATRVLNEAVLMFVKITQVLNKRDDLNDKITHVTFYNTLDEAKAASRTLQTDTAGPVGYLWMTKAIDTLKDDGSVDRVNENYMWTKRNGWKKQETKAYTISAEDVAKAEARRTGQPANGNAPFSSAPADDDADF